jgi:iron complex transport system substrate-binding protein
LEKLRHAIPLAAASAALAAMFAVAALVERNSPTEREESAGAPGARRPERIISISPATTETLYAVGAGPRVVGVTTFCDWPPEAKSLPKVGDFLRPDVEAIIALRPDLVVGSPSPSNRPAVLRLEALGVRVVVKPDYTVDELCAAILEIGRAAGEPQRSAALVAALRGAIAETSRKAASAPRRKVLFVVDHNPLFAAARGSIPDELIEAAGGVNVARDRGREFVAYSIEEAIAAAPEVIIDATMAGGSAADFWSSWKEIPAVASGRVHLASGDFVYMPGPRLDEGLREVAAAIHPEIFGARPGGQGAPSPGGAP